MGWRCSVMAWAWRERRGGGPQSGPPPGCYSGYNLVRWLRQKERGPALSGWPSPTESRTASTVSAPCRNIYSIAQPFSVVNTFFVWLPLAALAASLPRGRPRPRAGGGWALPAGLACAITPGPRRAACGPGREPAATVCAVRRSCRVACLPWPGPPRSFGGPWSRVSACCWDGLKERRALWWLRTKRPLTKRGRVWYS